MPGISVLLYWTLQIVCLGDYSNHKPSRTCKDHPTRSSSEMYPVTFLWLHTSYTCLWHVHVSAVLTGKAASVEAAFVFCCLVHELHSSNSKFVTDSYALRITYWQSLDTIAGVTGTAAFVEPAVWASALMGHEELWLPGMQHCQQWLPFDLTHVVIFCFHFFTV